MQLLTGARYSGTITLSGFEALASNDMVKEKLEGGGFSNVTVSGSGSSRQAQGTWTKAATADGAVPPQVTGLTMIAPPPAAPLTPSKPGSAAVPRLGLPGSAVVATIPPVTPTPPVPGQIPAPVLAVAFVAAGAAVASGLLWLASKALAGRSRAR
jgi:hypothetical protein